jgi:hypothetical protein
LDEKSAICPPPVNELGQTSSEAETHVPTATKSSPATWWQIADLGVLGAWIALVAFILPYHEKWADEAQAWLIARDLDLKTIWFHELRYEGSPGLWHTILWLAQHVLHAPYSALGGIGMACATAGVAFVLWKAPFPRPLRYMLVFSYFLVYQYAVIARSYNLLPLLVFAAAYFYRDILRPGKITAILVLLTLLSLHGTLIAAGIGLAYLLEAVKKWKVLPLPVRRSYAICIAIIALAFIFTFLIVKPTPDVDKFAKTVPQFQAPSTPAPKLSVSSRLVSIVSGALLDFIVPSIIFLGLAAAWCLLRRKFLAFALPTASLIVFYIWIHGFSHHHGTVFIAVIAGLWIAWPTRDEQRDESVVERRGRLTMTALLVCLLAVNIWDAAVSLRYEYLYPYSGAEDAARYLSPIVAQNQTIFGYTYGVAAVQAYFDHNIVGNIPTTYYHHGIPSYGAIIDLPQLQARRPEYLFFLSGSPQRELADLDPTLISYGYELAHFSDGYLFFKRSLMDRQVYVVYRRKY